MTVDLSDLPRHVTLVVGGRAEIPLPSYANSGNSWSAVCMGGQGVADVSIVFGKADPLPGSPGNGTSEPPPLTQVPEIAVAYGVVRGNASWRLVLARQFDPSGPTASHDLEVTVR
jgi:hypothetical protein